VIGDLFARLLADSPGIAAAMKAGKKTTISARVYRAKEGKWYDLGVVSRNEESWGAFFKRTMRWPKNVTVRFTVDGKEYDRG
jgi:hypothetical protein